MALTQQSQPAIVVGKQKSAISEYPNSIPDISGMNANQARVAMDEWWYQVRTVLLRREEEASAVDSSGNTDMTPATTVVAERSFGVAEAVGTSSNYAREDHTHGTPTNPIPAHVAEIDPHPQYITESELTDAVNAVIDDPVPLILAMGNSV